MTTLPSYGTVFAESVYLAVRACGHAVELLEQFAADDMAANAVR